MDQQADEIKRHATAQVAKSNTVPFSFIENLSLPVWCKDSTGVMLWINDAYQTTYGIRAAEYEGKTDYEVWPLEVANEYRKHDQEIVRTRLPTTTIEHIPDDPHNKNSPRRAQVVTKFPIFNLEGEVIAIGGVAYPQKNKGNNQCPLI